MVNGYYIAVDHDPDDSARGTYEISLFHHGETIRLSVGYQDHDHGKRDQIISQFTNVSNAIEWITWHKKVTGLTESVNPLDKRVMLYFQTRALEYETGPNFDVDAELINGEHPKLEIRFPEHYDYDIDVDFMDGSYYVNSMPCIRAVIDDRIDRNDGKLTYILLKTPDSINVFVDGGILGNGNDNVDCQSWEAAIDFFFREVKLRLDDIFMGDPSLSKQR